MDGEPRGDAVAGDGVSPGHGAKSMFFAECGGLLGAVLVGVFGEPFRVLAVHVVDTIYELIQEPDGIDAHADKVRRIVVDADAFGRTGLEGGAVTLGGATERAGSGPALDSEVCVVFIEDDGEGVQPFHHVTEVLTSRLGWVLREHDGEEVLDAGLCNLGKVCLVVVGGGLSFVGIGGEETLPALEIGGADAEPSGRNFGGIFWVVTDIDHAKFVRLGPCNEAV